MRRLLSIGLGTVLMLAFLAVAPSPAANAYTNSRLMDDQVFNNVNSMSQSGIQNFLGTVGSTCLTNFQTVNFHFDGTHWHYGDNTVSGHDSSGNLILSSSPWDSSWGPANIAASTAIYQAAQLWGINPQVIISTLQKEEALVTGTDCSVWRYNSAMGYGCPDALTLYNYPLVGVTNTCVSSAGWAGFGRQVLWGAYQLEFNLQRSYGNTGWDGDGSIVYGGFMTQGNRARCAGCALNFYDGNASIDGQTIFIENGATASLYSYTPHLNQSFPGIFQNWFGSTFYLGGTTNINWNFEPLDGGNDSPISGYTGSTGQTPNTILYNSTLHVFSYDATQKNLRHAYADNTGWHFEVLDGSGGANGRISADLGIGTASVVFNSQLHLFYYDQTNGDLRHASFDGTNWTFETLDGSGGLNGRINANLGYHPTVTAFGTGLQLFYYDATDTNLRHAWISSPTDTWHFEDLDGSSTGVSKVNGSIGSNPSTSTYGSSVQVFYYDNVFGNLRHGWSDAGGWHFENLDGDGGSIGHSDADLGMYSSALQYGTTLQVFYYDRSHGNLRHGWSDAGGWHFENLDGDGGSVGHRDSDVGQVPVTINFQNILYVFYYDAGSADILHAYSDSGGWHFGNLDGNVYSQSQRSSNTGPDSAVTEYLNGLQVYYYDSSQGSLRHAWGGLK